MQNNKQAASPSPYAGYSLKRGAGGPTANPAAAAAFNSDWGMMGGPMMNPFNHQQSAPQTQQQPAAPTPVAAAPRMPAAPNMGWMMPNMMNNFKNFVNNRIQPAFQPQQQAQPQQQQNADFYKGAPLRRGQQQRQQQQQQAQPAPLQVSVSTTEPKKAPALPLEAAMPVDVPTPKEVRSSTAPLAVPKVYDMWGSLDNTPLWKQASAEKKPSLLPAAAPVAIDVSPTNSPTLPLSAAVPNAAPSAAMESMWKTQSAVVAPTPMVPTPVVNSTNLTTAALNAFKSNTNNTILASNVAASPFSKMKSIDEKSEAEASNGGSDDLAWLDDIKDRVYAAMKEEDIEASRQEAVTAAFTMEWARHAQDNTPSAM